MRGVDMARYAQAEQLERLLQLLDLRRIGRFVNAVEERMVLHLPRDALIGEENKILHTALRSQRVTAIKTGGAAIGPTIPSRPRETETQRTAAEPPPAKEPIGRAHV